MNCEEDDVYSVNSDTHKFYELWNWINDFVELINQVVFNNSVCICTGLRNTYSLGNHFLKRESFDL